jgi:hypothetical protein
MEGVEAGYEWSFMNPTATLTTIAPYSTGTIEVAAGICTLTGGTWPAWAATLGTLTIDSTVYAITSRDSDTQLTVVGDDVTAGESDWSLAHAGYQDLPDDCGRVLGDFFFAPDIYCRSIPLVSEHFLLGSLQKSLDEARPQYACVRVKSDGDSDEREPAATGQRLEVAWWPIPDAVYALTYRYEAYSGKLTEALPYPLGGMRHSELIIESCLAVAEQRANDEKGLHWESFSRLLRSGIAMDRKQGAGYFGHMGGLQDGDIVVRHGAMQSRYDITYKGDTW